MNSHDVSSTNSLHFEKIDFGSNQIEIPGVVRQYLPRRCLPSSDLQSCFRPHSSTRLVVCDRVEGSHCWRFIGTGAGELSSPIFAGVFGRILRTLDIRHESEISSLEYFVHTSAAGEVIDELQGAHECDRTAKYKRHVTAAAKEICGDPGTTQDRDEIENPCPPVEPAPSGYVIKGISKCHMSKAERLFTNVEVAFSRHLFGDRHLPFFTGGGCVPWERVWLPFGLLAEPFSTECDDPTRFCPPPDFLSANCNYSPVRRFLWVRFVSRDFRYIYKSRQAYRFMRDPGEIPIIHRYRIKLRISPTGAFNMTKNRNEQAADAAIAVIEDKGSFQQRVLPWMMECFGAEISYDQLERGDRLVEELYELLQSVGYPRGRLSILEEYTYTRPRGEPEQEVGGVMVTLAAFCLAHALDMHGAAETELARIWTKVEAIRSKQAAKPKHSPLPVSEDVDRCIACLKVINDGDMVLHEIGVGGYIHADCCGPERESYCDADGEPLAEGDPLPIPFAYEADPRAASAPFDIEAFLMSDDSLPDHAETPSATNKDRLAAERDRILARIAEIDRRLALINGAKQ